MGLGNNETRKIIFCKLKTDKEEKSPSFGAARFFQSEKKGDSWVSGPAFKDLSGYLKDIKVKPYVWNGEQQESIEISLWDDANTDTVIVVQMGWGNITRQILNTLAGTEPLGLLSFSAGKQKDKNNPDKEHPAIWIKNNGEKSAWKFQPSEVPAVNKVTVGKKTVTDSSECDEFFKGVITQYIAPKFNLTHPMAKQGSPVSFAESGNLQPNQLPGDAEDDLPF